MAILMPPNALETLQIGDPWTFLSRTEAEMRHIKEQGIGGEFRYHFEGEQRARHFEIVRIHESINAVETKYLILEPEDEPS